MGDHLVVDYAEILSPPTSSLVGLATKHFLLIAQMRERQMGTKNNPGKYDCYANAKSDEPMFILLARDPMAPILVELWASLREHAAGNPSKVLEARDCAKAMREYRARQVREIAASLID